MARKAKPSIPDAPWPRDFVVTGKAGPKVNGKRVKAGQTISLGELEADHEIRMGSIEPAKPAAPPETE
ncbi:MAG: hypothetical protein H6887_14950 [Hoeflea sp.]|nr:hypothetical protein [Hoeflea sp.]